MICLKCGNKNVDGAKFCRYCGEPMEVPTPKHANTPTPAKKSRAGLVAFIIALVAAAGVGGFFWFRSRGNSGEKEAAESAVAEAAVPVSFHVNGDNYNEETSSPIAIRVVGKDADGNAVDRKFLIGGSEPAEIMLPPGEYTAEVMATPILEDGTIFRKPEALVAVSIPRSTSTAEESSDSSTQAAEAVAVDIELQPVTDIHEVTEEEIKGNTQILIDCGFDANKAEEFQEAAIKKTEELKTIWEEEHREYTAEITINAPGYDAETSSPIPCRLVGEDFEGNKINETFLVGSVDSSDIKLKRGTYQLEVLAPPILADGSTYADGSAFSGDTNVIEIVVERAEDQSANDVTVSAEITLAPRTNMREVTDDQLQKTYNALVDCGYDKNKAQAFLEAALKKRTEPPASREEVLAAFAEVIDYWKSAVVTAAPFDYPDLTNGGKYEMTDGISVGSGWGDDYSSAGYAFADINQDGVDELVIAQPVNTTDGIRYFPKWVYIYNYEKKTAQIMIEVAMRGVLFLKQDGTIWGFESNASGMSSVTEYQMDEDGLELEKIETFDGTKDADPMNPENYYGEDGTAYPAKEFLDNMNKDNIELTYTQFIEE